MSAWVKEVLPEDYIRTPSDRYERNDAAEVRVAVSRITTTDIAEIHALESRVYLFPWSPVVIADCIHSRYECWMMKQQEQVIAYGIMMVGSDESHLLNLCVAPDFRRQGYADYMVRFLSAVAIVQSVKRMFLEVRTSNYQAIDLYRKLGFRQVGCRVNYYPTETDREDALVFAKLL